MAGRVRYLVQRGDGFWARIVVPQRLRPILGTTELREPLGPLRSVAERNLHAAVARFHARLAQAERQLTITDPRHSRGRPLTLAQLARAHYAEELRLDTLDRDYPDRDVMVDMSWTRPARIEALRAVASGRASNEMMAATIGWAIDQFRERGNVAATPGSEDWRRLARALAGVELDALERIAERNRGHDTGQPKHPLLIVAPVSDPAKLVSLTALFDSYLKELKASGKGVEAERRWRPVIRDLSAFLGHEDAARIVKADVLRWKEARLGSHSAKTVRDVYLAALDAN